jgi:TRAP-type C4-dicarboxylate transport system permease small subunit
MRAFVFWASDIFTKLSDGLFRIGYLICVPFAAIFILTLLLQVFYRYVLSFPLIWYLEVVQLCYMYAIFMAIPLAYKKGSHVKFHFIAERLPMFLHKPIAVLGYLISLLFFAVLTIYGVKFIIYSIPVSTDTLRISNAWAFGGVPISGLMLFIHCLNFFFAYLAKNLIKSDGLPSEIRS